MFVDITGRQSGKTTRLVEELVDYLNKNTDSTALVVAPSMASRKHIVEMIHEKCGDPCTRRTITSYKMLPGTGKTLRQFVDEYMHIDDSLLMIDETAHYNGTGFLQEGGKALDIYNMFVKVSGIKPRNKLMRHGFTGFN